MNCKIKGPFQLAIDSKGKKLLKDLDTGLLFTLEDFLNCEIEHPTIVTYTKEPSITRLKNTPVKKASAVNTQGASLVAFKATFKPFYVLERPLLKPLEKLEETALPSAHSLPTIPTKPAPIGSDLTPFIAWGALMLSFYNRLRQKKKSVESSKCCSEVKLELENIKSDIEKSKKEENVKLIAEIAETKRELFNIKDQFIEVMKMLRKASGRDSH